MMTTYKKLQSDPYSRALFSNRITTMQGLKNALEDSSSTLISLDTEHFAVTGERDRILHQVGLAYLKIVLPDKLTPQEPLISSRPCLQEFYIKNEVQALTLNIELRTEEQDYVISQRGRAPLRRPHRFGLEQRVDIQDVEEAIINFIDNVSSTHTRLILTGFEMAAEWAYLSQYFPKIIPYFSLWVDIRDIAKDITSAGVIPGLTSLLQICGYHWKDIKSRSQGKSPPGAADNAGDDAISTLAAAHALLDSRIQEKLRFRQKCSQIARIHTTKKGNQSDIQHHLLPFTATIQSSHGSTLPPAIDSGMKLARRFFDFDPSSAGILSRQMAYIAFGNTNQLDQFIKQVDGIKLSPDVILSVRPLQNHTQKSLTVEAEKLGKQESREKKRLETSEDGLEDLDGLFGSPA
ncbi:hypothetical protein S40288_03114 [Stachybotrys chartarum IBT 40288]|nr:hypothetical protein S40288_03114 [Stachybotrys chartarum IBT 40288]